MNIDNQKVKNYYVIEVVFSDKSHNYKILKTYKDFKIIHNFLLQTFNDEKEILA